MDIRRVYDKFIDRINANGSGLGQHIGGLRQFIDAMNESQLSLMNEILRADESTDNLVEYLSPLVKEHDTVGVAHERYYKYELPKDFEHQKDVYINGVKGEHVVPLTVRSRRIGEVGMLYNDALYGPSIGWEETFSTKHSDHIRVYRQNFDLSDFILVYYRKPTLVDIEGYTDSTGTPSTNIDPDFEGRFLEMILDRAAKIHFRNTQPERAQLFN